MKEGVVLKDVDETDLLAKAKETNNSQDWFVRRMLK